MTVMQRLVRIALLVLGPTAGVVACAMFMPLAVVDTLGLALELLMVAALGVCLALFISAFFKRRAACLKTTSPWIPGGFPIRTFAVMMLFALQSQLLSIVFYGRARAELRQRLARLDDAQVRVLIDDAECPQPQRVLAAVGQLRRMPHYRITHVNPIVLVISDGSETITLGVTHPTGIQDQYWISYPRYRTTLNYDVAAFRYDGDFFADARGEAAESDPQPPGPPRSAAETAGSHGLEVREKLPSDD